jgi:hypothetical protein
MQTYTRIRRGIPLLYHRSKSISIREIQSNNSQRSSHVLGLLNNTRCTSIHQDLNLLAGIPNRFRLYMRTFILDRRTIADAVMHTKFASLGKEHICQSVVILKSFRERALSDCPDGDVTLRVWGNGGLTFLSCMVFGIPSLFFFRCAGTSKVFIHSFIHSFMKT